jgi:betaine reductase
MTNLFDGVSFILQKNNGNSASSSGEQTGVSEHAVKRLIAESLRELARSMGAE